MQRAVWAANLHDAERHVLDDAGAVVDLHDIADHELVLEQQKEAGDQVLDEALRAE